MGAIFQSFFWRFGSFTTVPSYPSNGPTITQRRERGTQSQFVSHIILVNAINSGRARASLGGMKWIHMLISLEQSISFCVLSCRQILLKFYNLFLSLSPFAGIGCDWAPKLILLKPTSTTNHMERQIGDGDAQELTNHPRWSKSVSAKSFPL